MKFLHFDPTPEQKEVINTEKSALIIAGPGTGKTRTAIEKARAEIKKINDNNKKILFLSFSNATIFKLIQTAAVDFKAEQQAKVRFQTYHSCAAEILRNYGRFVGLPPLVSILDTLEEKLFNLESGIYPTHPNYFNELLKMSRSHGYLAFETLIPLSNRLLLSSNYLRSILGRCYPLIIVDEFQDTSEEQWKLLQLLGQDAQVICFGDPNQIIYSSLHAATEKRFEHFMDWKKIDRIDFSTKNFRCENHEILEFADALLYGKPFKVQGGMNVQLFEIPYREQLRIHLAIIWKTIREQIGKNKTIAFFVPSNKIAEQVAVDLRNPPESSKISFPVYAQIIYDQAAYDAVLLALTALRDFSIFLDEATCRKAAVALLAMDHAWNHKKKMSVKRLNETIKWLREDNEKLSLLFQSLKIAQNITQHLNQFIETLRDYNEFSSSCKRILAHGNFRKQMIIANEPQMLLFDEFRSRRSPKGLYGIESGFGNTHILNYHKTKGREFDFVVLIVDPRGESSHAPLDERRRLHYVCATRARNWLGVVYYKNDLGSVLGPVLSPA